MILDSWTRTAANVQWYSVKIDTDQLHRHRRWVSNYRPKLVHHQIESFGMSGQRSSKRDLRPMYSYRFELILEHWLWPTSQWLAINLWLHIEQLEFELVWSRFDTQPVITSSKLVDGHRWLHQSVSSRPLLSFDRIQCLLWKFVENFSVCPNFWPRMRRLMNQHLD